MYLEKKLTEYDKKLVTEYPELKTGLLKIKHNRAIDKGITNRDTHDQNFNRLYYIRYADDILIGFVGSKSQANEIYCEVTNFLSEQLKLTCNKEKSKIIHNSKSCRFLGTDIY